MERNSERLLVIQSSNTKRYRLEHRDIATPSSGGRSQMTSAEFSGFLTPSPCQYQSEATSLPLPTRLTSFVHGTSCTSPFHSLFSSLARAMTTLFSHISSINQYAHYSTFAKRRHPLHLSHVESWWTSRDSQQQYILFSYLQTVKEWPQDLEADQSLSFAHPPLGGLIHMMSPEYC